MENTSNITPNMDNKPKTSTKKMLVIGGTCLAILAIVGSTAVIATRKSDKKADPEKETVKDQDKTAQVTPTANAPRTLINKEITTIPVGRDASTKVYSNRQEMSEEDMEKLRLDKLTEADGIALEYVKKLREVANFYPEDDGSVPDKKYLDDLLLEDDKDMDIDYLAPTKISTPTVTPTRSGNATVSPTRSGSTVTPTRTSTPTPTKVSGSETPTSNQRVSPSTYEQYLSYITPNDSTVASLAKNKTKEQLFKESLDWVWVEDLSLHKVDEHWMKPAKFLESTPKMSTNPQSGRISSDCEEHAMTLVSALRASGVKPEHVRVSLGKVDFGGSVGGHAWVQLYDEKDGKWFDLEPSSGDSVDPKTGKYTESEGLAFDYFKKNKYPVVEEFMYFNDQYFMDFMNNKTNAPTLW